MKAHQFLFEKGYTQKVRYPDGKEEVLTFNCDAVIRLMTEYVEYLANDESKQQSNCNLPDVSNNEVAVCESCENKLLCKKHGVYGINCVKLNIKQTDC